MLRPMRRVQQAAYPMVKLTQAEVAAMIGRREERRRLAEVAQLWQRAHRTVFKSKEHIPPSSVGNFTFPFSTM